MSAAIKVKKMKDMSDWNNKLYKRYTGRGGGRPPAIGGVRGASPGKIPILGWPVEGRRAGGGGG